MNLDLSIENLEKAVHEIKKASLSDDKTLLGNALGLKKESDLIDTGQSEFNVIIFGDLNDFKSLNDTHTHEAGDTALRETGKSIYELFVEKLNAKAFRPSGDEFVILINENNLADFTAQTENFKSINFNYKGKKLSAKMSFGIAINDNKTSFSELLGRAETACLTAKNIGDGISVIWNEEIEQNALESFRKKCEKCNSVNRCFIPKRNAPKGISYCANCGRKF